MKYKPSRLGVKNKKDKIWWVYVSVPKPLQSILKKDRLRRSTGTTDRKIAVFRQREKEDEMYLQLDHADLANHPLPIAANALINALGRCHPYPIPNPAIWFQKIERFEAYDQLRLSAMRIIQVEDYEDLNEEDSMVVEHIKKRVVPLFWDFETEFNKVSTEQFSPVNTRGPSFMSIAKQYFESTAFINLTREKTKKDYTSKIELFNKWAGNIGINEIDHELGDRFIEALITPEDNNFFGGGYSKSTAKKYINSIKLVLDYAFPKYLHANPWDKLSLAKKGARPQQDRQTISDGLLKQLFSLKMPYRDRLCISLMVTTGCRIDEIALLKWQDILHCTKDGSVYSSLEDAPQDEEIFNYFDLNRINAIVKGNNSRREVVIVAAVWKIMPPRGAPEERLFKYSLDTDGKASNKASRACMLQLRKVTKDTRHVNHSFRHTFVQKTRQVRVDPELRAFIIGSSSAGFGEGMNYGGPHNVYIKSKALEKIDWSSLNFLGLTQDAHKVHPT